MHSCECHARPLESPAQLYRERTICGTCCVRDIIEDIRDFLARCCLSQSLSHNMLMIRSVVPFLHDSVTGGLQCIVTRFYEPYEHLHSRLGDSSARRSSRLSFYSGHRVRVFMQFVYSTATKLPVLPYTLRPRTHTDITLPNRT